MTLSPILIEVIQQETHQLNKDEMQSYLKEAIEKVAFYYNTLENRTFLHGDKTFLQAYWKVKLDVLLSLYQERYDKHYYFLTQTEEEFLKKYKEVFFTE